MTKKFFSTMVAVAIFVGVFGLLRFANAQEDTDVPSTTTSVGNQAPIITAVPSDGGSNTGTAQADPTADGSNVTFAVTAKDVNTDQYYAAFCSSDQVSHGGASAPTCEDADHTWAVSAATNSDAQASVTYTTGSNTNGESACTSDEECAWYAFVCDAVASGGICFPANGSGDQGSAIGTVTFADVPADQTVLTVDSADYEFDNGGTCTTSPSACVNTATLEDGADTAAAVVSASGSLGASSTMYSRGNVIYVYADAKGAAGNTLGVSETDDTGNVITPVDTANGDDDNASPFAINHAPNIASYAYGDTTGSGSAHASGTVEPDDTVFFSIDIDDLDVQGGQDTIDMYVCATDSFTPGTGCAGGQEICQSLAVSATDSTYAECSSATIASIPTANDTYTVYVFAEDQHQYQATYSSDDQTRTYDVEDVAPYLDATYGGGDGYIVVDTPAPSAGGSDDADFSFRIIDNNGDNDIVSARGMFFLGSATSSCSEDENDCYIDADCTLDTASTPTAAGTKTADGIDETRIASCTVTVWFNATPGTWNAAGFATDEAVEEGPFTTSTDSITVGSLQGIDVVQTEIAYSTVAIGGTSDAKETSIGNVGNIDIDVQVSGTAMACQAGGACEVGVDSIAAAQQRWNSTSAPFDWDDGETPTDPGPWTLVATAGTADETEGCLNRDIAVRDDHTSATETNESIYWKIRIPASQAAGSYTGSNTFTSGADTLCNSSSEH